MPNNFKGLTDHPFDRRKTSKRTSKNTFKHLAANEDNPPFLDFDNDDIATINYFDNLNNKYQQVRTTLHKKDAEPLTNDELNKLAFGLLTGKNEEIKAKYQIGSVEIPQKRSYIVSGNSSIKKLDIGIYASATEDETALHYLLGKVRETL